jgi:chemotaxis response regulator CheB
LIFGWLTFQFNAINKSKNEFIKKMKPDIIIVDNHLIFRQGLKANINFENVGALIAEVSDGDEFIELLSTLKPDLVLMDIDKCISNHR